MRWTAVASVVVAAAVACGGRSEYFDDRAIIGDAGDGSGGRGGKGGSGGKGSGGSGVGGTTGGTGGTGGSVGGSGGSGGGGGSVGGGPAGSGGVGGSFAGFGGSFAGFGGSLAGSGGSFAGFGGSFAGFGGSLAGSGGASGNGGVGGATPDECLVCITTVCEEVQSCFSNPACVSGTFCGISSCGGLEGSAAIDCWVSCYGGDAALALTALNAVLCLQENCSMACAGFGQ